MTGLSVGGSRVTEAGVRAVVADRGKRLRLLGARGVGVGDEFVAELAAAAPNALRFLAGVPSITTILTLARD